MAEKYPLHQLQEIKKRRLEEAERVLRQKREELAKEQKILAEKEKERNEAKKHRQDTLEKLRADMDAGEKTNKIEMAKRYLEIVDRDVEKKEAAVKAQVQVVEDAEKAVEDARQNMLQKQMEVEKLSEHKKAWAVELKKEQQHADNVLSDELGTAMHNLKKQKDG